MGDLPASLAAARQRALNGGQRPRPRPLPRTPQQSYRSAFWDAPETHLPYRAPAQALADRNTLPYVAQETPGQRHMRNDMAQLADRSAAGGSTGYAERNQVREFGNSLMEATGAPSWARGIEDIQYGQPGRAIPEFLNGALATSSLATLPYGAGASAPIRGFQRPPLRAALPELAAEAPRRPPTRAWDDPNTVMGRFRGWMDDQAATARDSRAPINPPPTPPSVSARSLNRGSEMRPEISDEQFEQMAMDARDAMARGTLDRHLQRLAENHHPDIVEELRYRATSGNITGYGPGEPAGSDLRRALQNRLRPAELPSTLPNAPARLPGRATDTLGGNSRTYSHPIASDEGLGINVDMLPSSNTPDEFTVHWGFDAPSSVIGRERTPSQKGRIGLEAIERVVQTVRQDALANPNASYRVGGATDALSRRYLRTAMQQAEQEGFAIQRHADGGFVISRSPIRQSMVGGSNDLAEAAGMRQQQAPPRTTEALDAGRIQLSDLQHQDPLTATFPWEQRYTPTEDMVRDALTRGATRGPASDREVASWRAREHAERIATLMREGWDDPITLRNVEGRLAVDDGYHRLAAARLRGDTSIQARPRTPPRPRPPRRQQ